MQKLNLVEAETLLYEPLEKPSFVVDGLIPTGLSLLCGSQKIGKSWLMLKLCLQPSSSSFYQEHHRICEQRRYYGRYVRRGSK